MKVLLFLGLVGAAIYGALVLSSDYLLPRDPGDKSRSRGKASVIRANASCVRGARIFPP